MWHDGREFVNESRWLAAWQRTYRERVNRRGADPTGVYDGDTQRAVRDVQTKCGLPVDGLLGPEVWAATWVYKPPPREKPPAVPAVEPMPRWKVAALKNLKKGRVSSKGWHYWRKFSNYRVQYGTDPDAPPWWPGRVFGRNEQGWHVREIQNLLGIKETGFFNADTDRRIRGLQCLHKVPESGVVDVRTALLIDPGPWPEDEPEPE